ncbi:MAG: endonuclease/exonuclease/phosphatase family protein [Phycisphaerae bacterium]
MKRLIIAIWVAPALIYNATACAQTGTFIDRQDPADLRIADYNVNFDSILPGGSQEQQFQRIIAALQPDIMTLQEITVNPQQVADIFDAVLPLPGGQLWQASMGHTNVTVSKYPQLLIASDTVPPGQRPQIMSLIDLPNADFTQDIYLINEHYKCCSGGNQDDLRQQQSDAVINWMRDARNPGESIDLPQDTPMVVLGDLNIVGGPAPLNTLIDGNIFDEATYGLDSPPDWDGTTSTDLHPLHNGVGPDDYTWRNDNSSFAPGRLDYVIYTDSVMTPANNFVLDTTLMTPAELAATGLQEFDVVLNPPGQFDHLPLVVDFRFAGMPIVPDGDLSLDGLTNGEDVQWFADLMIAGAGGDPNRIGHGDYDQNGVVDFNDIPPFVADLLAP